MTELTSQIDNLGHLFQEHLTEQRSMSRPLHELLLQTKSRAVGMWRVQGDRLIMSGFEAAPEMPGDVAEEFEAATREVPLSEDNLGIVRAVLTETLIVASVDVPLEELKGSVGWLGRFEARQSLSIPIQHQQQTVGVLAISTPHQFDSISPEWKIATGLADRLGATLGSN